MAKRRDRRRTIKTESGDEYLYDGVHARLLSRGNADDTSEFLFDRRGIFDVLNDAEKQAVAVLEPHIITPGTHVGFDRVLTESFSLKDDAPERARDAIDVLRHVDLARRQLEDCQKGMGDVHQAAMNCINVGVFAERMRLRPLGSAYLESRESEANRHQGPEARKKKAAKLRKTYQDDASQAIARWTKKLSEGNRTPTKGEIERHAAKELGIKQRALQARLEGDAQ